MLIGLCIRLKRRAAAGSLFPSAARRAAAPTAASAGDRTTDMANDIDQGQQKNDSDGNTLHGNLQDSMATRQGGEPLLTEMKIVFNKLFTLWG